MADLYRKSSLDKLSNPEQLDRMIKISSPLSWLALIAVLLVIPPVFFDLAGLRSLQLLLPPTYFIQGGYNPRYLCYLAIYDVIVGVLILLFEWIRKLKIRKS